MSFYKTIIDIHYGSLTPSEQTAKTVSTGLLRLQLNKTNLPKTLEMIAEKAGIPNNEAEHLIYEAVLASAPYACVNTTKKSAKAWGEISPTSLIEWGDLAVYKGGKACCGGCPVPKLTGNYAAMK